MSELHVETEGSLGRIAVANLPKSAFNLDGSIRYTSEPSHTYWQRHPRTGSEVAPTAAQPQPRDRRQGA